MKRSIHRFGWLCALLAVASWPGFAEVSTDLLAGGQVQIVVLGSTEGPDPFGMSWRPYRDIPLFRILNASGDNRGDGRPDIVLPPGGQFVVGWAWNNGTDHDIAISEWTPEGWIAPQFLTASALDDLDPRLVATDSGTVHVVWWTRQSQAIRFSSRHSGSNVWAIPSDVTTATERGRRPTVVVWDDSVHVGFERDSDQPDLAQEIVIKRHRPDGVFTDTTVARTMRTDRLDPVLHAENGWLWMDWKHSDTHLAYVVNGGEGWSEPITIDWPDPSWVGVEDARQQIRQLVMGLGEAPILSAAERRGAHDPPRQAAMIGDPFGSDLISAPVHWNVNPSSGIAEQQFKEERKQP